MGQQVLRLRRSQCCQRKFEFDEAGTGERLILARVRVEGRSDQDQCDYTQQQANDEHIVAQKLPPQVDAEHRTGDLYVAPSDANAHQHGTITQELAANAGRKSLEQHATNFDGFPAINKVEERGKREA